MAPTRGFGVKFMAPTIPIEYTAERESIVFTRTKGSADVMGKTRKVSKGFSSGFVPDYRHAVVAVTEPKDFRSSVQGNRELNTLEDSYLATGKDNGLDMDFYDRSIIPNQLHPLSKMSHFERRELRLRLKNELERVRNTQKMISSFGQTQPKRPPKFESLPVSASGLFMVVPGKMKPSAVRGGPRTKSGVMTTRKNESVRKGASQNVNFATLMKQCETLLSQLMLLKNAQVFNKPVDIVEHKIPDYFDIIKQPMDLGTVMGKLCSGQYESLMEFAEDVRLTFRNAMTYNSVGHPVNAMALACSKSFETKWKTIEKKIPLVTVDQSAASLSCLIEEPDFAEIPPAKKQKINSMENNVRHEISKRVISDAERQKLAVELESCLDELPPDIINVLKENTPASNQIEEDEIEIDLDFFNDDALFVLRKLMDDYLLNKQKNLVVSEPCETEINKEPDSNISDLPFKGNEQDDEVVDIVGNDLPPSGVVPSEIDNNVSRNNINHSSSKSSSSDSGSSSSDADSGSSSDSEVDGGKDSTLDETVYSRVEPKETNIGDPNGRDHWNRNAETNSGPNQSSVEPDCLKEGESASLDQQVSPDKLYRVALLRSRFADIIIKAQENTTDTGQKPEPERLKHEREEHERRRKEEKTRLQAEAKAAEEAKRKAEAEAAAEAKRIRELEREAARQALLKMEKTVDINENSQFMEDLELFKAAPLEELDSFKEASPENSPNVLGSFNFRANSNPLEQLGLYMKNDEEEDEDLEHDNVTKTSNDPEGEIDREET